ncbi:MAG: hypothetical protein HYU66_18500 [Armatimonadetes bacterium]|nr:hypothetical protein [Armatimonadota bacterium]
MAPKMAQAHYNLGRTFQARDRIEDAIRSYENALRANRDYAPARAALEALHATLSPDLRDTAEEVHPGEDPAALPRGEMEGHTADSRRTR